MFKIYTFKAFIIIGLCSVSSVVLCWNNTIKNDTNGEIVVTITYAGVGICSPEIRVLEPNQEITVDSKICCAESVSIRASSGTMSGQTYYLDTPRAGINMTCAHFRVRVYGATGNKLMAEANLG
ncbi:hypothetical protein EKK58_03740 [Candidatus Dependentiae bacterium]|nr:MAG: hypothetical protein EKK58_03740 [Candidatus Dependentiae bacterium]